MSGHSKWSTIKHKKALTDAKKGKVFSKIAAQISLAAKTGGDPTMNPNLRVYLDKARQAGMPKDNIERAIKRGTSGLSGATLEEIAYEVYGLGGVGIIIEAVSDNKNRTIAEIKSVLNKYGAKLADTGSVGYLFEKQGKIVIKKDDRSFDEISLMAIDAGASDIVETGDSLEIYSKPTDLESVKKSVMDFGVDIELSEISLEPKQIVPLAGDKQEQVVRLLEALDDLDDITNISTNAEI